MTQDQTPQNVVATSKLENVTIVKTPLSRRDLEIPNIGVLLTTKGILEQHEVKADIYERPAESPAFGAQWYHVEAGMRFWNPQPIPAGFVTLHCQGDPEPVTTREPRGLGAEIFARIGGPLYPRLFDATDLPPEKHPINWPKLAMWGGGGLLGACLLYYAYTSGWLSALW